MHSSLPLRHAVVFDEPRRLTDVSSWHEHIPFAFFAVAALRPRVLVELGTWKGDSYCAFCQAVQALELPTRCHAVDTWEGDEHTGRYGPDVLDDLRAHHDPLYGAFSTLVKESFDEAAPRFADGSIDLLHIDGTHSYEAVSHDVETWLPKLGDRGVLLLHDTSVREERFGVWRVWEELSARHPGFAFAHGHGLGVLAVGREVDPEFVAFLEAANREPAAERLFAALGERIALPAAEQRERTAERRARAAAEETLAGVQAALDSSRADATRLRHERDRLEASLRDRERELANVVESASWRITSPLRTAKREIRKARHLVRRAQRRRSAPGWTAPRLRRRDPPDTGSRRRRALTLPARLDRHARPQHRPEVARARGRVRPEQTYPHWQLCLADDGSTDGRTLEYLRGLEPDPAIDVLHGEGGGISSATNRALAAATGEFVAFLDHDDELHPDALLECVRMLNEKPKTDAIYTDEDKLDRRGNRSEPFFKPDWSPELFRGGMYVGHLLFVRRALVESCGGLDPAFDGVQDYELMLRISERTDRIEHVPRILYHWRKLPGSVASSLDAKPGISELQAAAVNAHLERMGIASVARPNPALPHRAVLDPSERPAWPRVTVIVPTKDAPRHLSRCLESIFGLSTYPSFEVVLVDTGTTDPAALRLFEEHPVEVLPFEGAFNFSRVNNFAVEHAGGEFVVFLNNDTEVRSAGWLETMVGLAEQPDVGAVGPLLVYPNGRVQHAGVVLGLRGTADHIMRGFPAGADGYAGSLSCTREVTAVTAACMLVRRELFLEVGAFDEHFATHYQDVDLCLRLRRAGRRNLYTPRAVLAHHESATRGSAYDHVDRALLLEAWGETISRGDPYYNPSLSLAGADYRPRARARA